MNQQQQNQLHLGLDAQHFAQNFYPDFSLPTALNNYDGMWVYPFFIAPDYQFNSEFFSLPAELPRTIPRNSATTQTMDSDFQKESARISEMADNHNNQMPFEQAEKLHNKISYLNDSDDKFDKNALIELKQSSQIVLMSSSQPSHPQESFRQFQKTFRDSLDSNRQFFDDMLKHHSINKADYWQLSSSKKQKGTFFPLIVKHFDAKIASFKKSKQEMIKLIIRRVQRHYKVKHNCKKDERFKKYGGFKSMNSAYLQKLFSDHEFCSYFLQVIKVFYEEFDKQNLNKIDAFMAKICTATNMQDFKISIRSLDEKNKMPWPALWKQKLRRVIDQLTTTYLKPGQHSMASSSSC